MREESWELYSQILAQENLNLVYSRYAKTAYFDLTNRNIVVPTFDYMTEEISQLLISHEVGHACFSTYKKTEYDEYMRKYKDLFNVIEDAHIENRLKKEFHGLKSIFQKGYKDLFKNNFFEVKKEEVKNLSLTSRLNLFYKIGNLLSIPFKQKESEFALKMKKVESKKDVLSLCQEIYDYLKEEKTTQKEQNDNEENDKNSQTTENTEYEKNNSFVESQTSLEKKSSHNEKMSIKTELKDSINNIFEYNLEKYGEEQLKKNTLEKKVYFSFSTKNAYNSLIDYSKYYTKNSYYKKTNGGKALTKRVQSLAKSCYTIFQQKKKAEEMKSSYNIQVGKLNNKKIANYKISENIFRRLKITKEGKNHGVVIMVDYSGSMTNYLKDTLLQACILGEFCRLAEIPFSILAYGVILMDNDTDEKGYVALLGNNEFFDIPAILSLSSLNNVFVCGDTPTIDAILASTYILKKFKECGVEKTSLYILTDGVYSNVYLENNTKQCINRTETSITIDNFLYKIEDYIPKKKRYHDDWIIELLLVHLKKVCGSFISISYLGSYTDTLQMLSEKILDNFPSKLKFNIPYRKKSYMDDYLYLWKHAYYFEDCKKVPLELKKGILMYKFKNNPFLDLYQVFDIDEDEEKKETNIVTKKSLYYKKLKIFVHNFIEEFS